MTISPITCDSYILYDDSKQWLGQVVLTSNGMFSSVTDYGNLSYTWCAIGDQSFKEFIIGISEDYLADKLYLGISYIASSKKIRQSCKHFSSKILPALKKVLKEELSFKKG